MPFVKLPGGIVAHVKMAKRPYRHCTCYLGPGAARCGARAPFLCDFPVGRRTCDRPLCADHATEEGPDRHYCPEHAGKVPVQGALF